MSAVTTRRRRRSPRKTLYRVHSWAGFQLALLTFVVLLSGTLAVVGDEIDWLLDSDRRVAPTGGLPDWDGMYDTAVALHPEYSVASIGLGELSVMAATVGMTKPDGNPHLIFVHPVSGELRGEGHWLSAQRILRDLHRYLFITILGLGLPVVTVAAIVLAVQLVTGLLTIRRWRQAAVTLRAGKGARILIGDLHRAAGLWTFWFTLLIVITSLWYFAEWTMWRSGYRPEAPRVNSVAVADESTNEMGAESLLPVSRYADAAQSAFPQLRPTTVLFPSRAGGTVTVHGSSTTWLLRDRASRVFLDPRDAGVLRVQRPEDLTVLQYMTELADPWHFGDVGGLATKLLWFVSGLVLTALSATGVWLTWRRTRQGVGKWHWATLGVMGVATVFGAGYIARYLG